MITNKPAIALEGVSFSREQTPVFRDLSLSITEGEFVALLGTNGSGKSTLLDLIAGVLTPSTGSVVRGSANYAFVPQRTTVNEHVPMTVEGAVAMGRWAHLGRFGRLTRADRTVIAERMEQLGITDLARAQISELSGGQRQRTLIAQALCQEAPLILLDEPEAGLDEQARGIIQSTLLAEAAQGTTVVVATHERDSAALADRCILLKANAGGIIADGTPETVLTDESLARAFHACD